MKQIFLICSDEFVEFGEAFVHSALFIHSLPLGLLRSTQKISLDNGEKGKEKEKNLRLNNLISKTEIITHMLWH